MLLPSLSLSLSYTQKHQSPHPFSINGCGPTTSAPSTIVGPSTCARHQPPKLAHLLLHHGQGGSTDPPPPPPAARPDRRSCQGVRHEPDQYDKTLDMHIRTSPSRRNTWCSLPLYYMTIVAFYVDRSSQPTHHHPTDVVSKIGSQIMREKVAFKKTLSIFENFGLFTAFLRGGRFPLAPPPIAI